MVKTLVAVVSLFGLLLSGGSAQSAGSDVTVEVSNGTQYLNDGTNRVEIGELNEDGSGVLVNGARFCIPNALCDR
jgi:hypothetical protein